MSLIKYIIPLVLTTALASCTESGRDADTTSPFLGTWIESHSINSYRKSKSAETLCYLGEEKNDQIVYLTSIITIDAKGVISNGTLDLKSLTTDITDDRISEVSNWGEEKGYKSDSTNKTYSLSNNGKKLTTQYYSRNDKGVMELTYDRELYLYNVEELSLISKDLENCDEADLGGDNVENDEDITNEFFNVVSGKYGQYEGLPTRGYLDFGIEKSTFKKYDTEYSFLRKDDTRITDLLANPEKHLTDQLIIVCSGEITYDNIVVRIRGSKEKTVKYDGKAYKGYGGDAYMTYSPKSQAFSEVTVSYTEKESGEFISLSESEFNRDFALNLCEVEFFEHPEIEFLVSWGKEKIVTTRYDVNSKSGALTITYNKLNQ